MVKPADQSTIPMIIQNRNFAGLAPKEIPIAAPRGAPTKSGASKPRPITPDRCQIRKMIPFSWSGFSSLRLRKIQFLARSPRAMTMITPVEAPRMVAPQLRMGFSFRANPVGMDAQSSRAAIPNTVANLKKISRTASFFMALIQAFAEPVQAAESFSRISHRRQGAPNNFPAQSLRIFSRKFKMVRVVGSSSSPSSRSRLRWSRPWAKNSSALIPLA